MTVTLVRTTQNRADAFNYYRTHAHMHTQCTTKQKRIHYINIIIGTSSKILAQIVIELQPNLRKSLVFYI